jgi:hypothetical protein
LQHFVAQNRPAVIFPQYSQTIPPQLRLSDRAAIVANAAARSQAIFINRPFTPVNQGFPALC